MGSRYKVLAGAAAAISVVLTGTASAAEQAPDPREWPLDAQHFDATKAWELSKGAGIVVAVVDTGVNSHHPDLTGRVLPGVDLTLGAADGQVDVSPDSHGTSVAGVIAGNGGPSGRGMSGLAPEARILPVRVSNGEGVNALPLAQGIVWAARHGAAVINVSMGMASADPQVREAVDFAESHDVVVVAAAGNAGATGNVPQYPAAFRGVVAVAGSDRSGAPWVHSESGPFVSLSAPATGIWSVKSGGGYLTADGTSYAAPYVAATAALLRAKYPRETASQIISRLVGSADRPRHSAGRDDRFGFGIVDPVKALEAPTPSAASDPLKVPPAKASGTARAVGSSSSAFPIAGVVGGGAAAAAAATFVVVRRRSARPRTDPPR
ncbi:type VII secretion-associated serine protease mycosin [Actinacidiphila alni]|uniref:Type VII secretion-associated serine protease mycosin n=1 Tax=Actinacidiphila alni TaxID=380248 RepID=A0A1I2JM77_9ACTN|nr:type VII secretion-associated serine protease mycosin [Actinacidiphila alni]SFF55208.1 type VII secretion-associated serine protease mycosin [Actinacidiphila alni]